MERVRWKGVRWGSRGSRGREGVKKYLGSVFGVGEGLNNAIYGTAVRNELVVVGLEEVRT